MKFHVNLPDIDWFEMFVFLWDILLQDAIDRTNERGVPVNMAAVSLPSQAQMKTKQQQQHTLSWPSPKSPPAAMTILAGDCETGSLHPGADGSGIKQLNMGKDSVLQYQVICCGLD